MSQAENDPIPNIVSLKQPKDRTGARVAKI
jgi:hypothetical protein